MNFGRLGSDETYAILIGTGTLTGGVASINTNPANEFKNAGTRPIIAVYPGDANNTQCTSQIYIQQLTGS